MCDGHKNCEDGSDESFCEKEFKKCSRNEFECLSGDCIDIKKYCNMEIDCKDGSDEDFCENFNCGETGKYCDDGECIQNSQICDNIFDCIDFSDEHACKFKIKKARCRVSKTRTARAFLNVVENVCRQKIFAII